MYLLLCTSSTSANGWGKIAHEFSRIQLSEIMITATLCILNCIAGKVANASIYFVSMPIENENQLHNETNDSGTFLRGK